MSRLKSSSTFTIHSTSSFLHHLSLFFFLLLVFLPPPSFTYAQSSLGQPTSDISWRAGHSACIISNYMVLFGGVTSSSVNMFANTAATNDVVVWNVLDQRWYKPGITAVTGSEIPNPQKFVPCVGFSNGKMFVLIANSTDNIPAKNIAVLDTNFWNWQQSVTTSPPPDFRLGATLTAVNDTLYRYAGQQAIGGNQVQGINNLLYSLNSKTLIWTSLANGPSLAYHTACYLQKFDIIAVFGGQNTDLQPQDVLTTYSVTKGVWNQFVQITSTKPSARLGHTAVCTEDKMIIFGGGTISSNGGTPSDNSVWLATATSENSFSWTTPVTDQTNAPAARMGHSAVLSGNNMIVFGGIGSAVNDKSVYILDINKWTWSSVSPGGNPSQPQTAASGSTTSAPPPITAPSSQKKPVTVIIAAAISGLVGVLFLTAAFFIGARHYRRKNRKLQFDDDEMSEVDSALGGNSTDMAPPPRSREVILSSPVAARLANKDTVFSLETLPRLQQIDGIDKREPVVAPEAARAAPLNPWGRANGPRGHYVRGSTDSFGNWRGKNDTGEEEEAEADRWTFASSFSYDREREKDQSRDGSTPPIRYMPQRMDSVGSMSSTFGQRGGHTFPYHHGHNAHATHPWMQSRGDYDDPNQSVPLAMPVQPEVIVTAPRVPPNVVDYNNVGSGLNAQQFGNSNSNGGGHIRAATISGLDDNQMSLNDTLSPLDRIARLFSGGDVSGAIGLGEKEYPQSTHQSTNEDTSSVRGQSVFTQQRMSAIEDTSSNPINPGNNTIYNASSLHQSAEDVNLVKDAVSLRGAISVTSIKEMTATHSRDEKLTAQNLYRSSPSQESITKIADLAGSSGSHQQEVASVEGGGETNKDRKRWSWG